MRSCLSVGACVLVVSSSLAFAQSASVQTGPSRSGTATDADAGGIENIVVTATRRTERLKDVPLTVSTLSSEQLVSAGVTSVRDLQNLVSGFTFGGLGTFSQPSIRGITMALVGTGEENPNALYVDGIYQSSQPVLNQELPDIDHIEVLKGPQGTLFGRNAEGGAIQIFTREPSYTPTVDATIEQGYYPDDGTNHSSPRTNVRTFLSGPIVSDKLAASISGGFDYTPGYEWNDADHSEAGKIAKLVTRGKLLYDPLDSLEITFGAFYLANKDEADGLGTPSDGGLSAAKAYPGPDLVVPVLPYHVAYDGPPAQDDNSVYQYGYTGRIKWVTDYGTLTSLTGFTDTKTFIENSIHNARGTEACQLAFVCIDYNYTQHSREYSQELNFASVDFGPFNFVSGLYFYDNTGQTFSQFQLPLAQLGVPGFPYRYSLGDTHLTSYAAYAEANFKVTDRLTLVAGLRENHEPHTDMAILPTVAQLNKVFNSTTPRVSAKYVVTPDLNAYATFSVGEKSGSTGVLNFQSVPQYAPVLPEKLYAYETGLKYAAHDLTIDGSFYYYDERHKQVQTFTGLSEVVTNTGRVTIFGLDLDAAKQLTPQLTLNGNASWIPTAQYDSFPNAAIYTTTLTTGGYAPATIDANGYRLERTPRWTANSTLAYTDGLYDASATLDYSSAVKQDLSGIVTQGSYWTLNLEAGFHFNEAIRLGIYARNLNNALYIMAESESAAGFVSVYAPPRELGISLGVKY